MIKEKVDELIKKTRGEMLSRKEIFAGSFIKVFEEKYKLPNDRVVTKESVVKNNNKDAVIVITTTIDNKYLLVFQNRIDDVVSIEFPSGYVEENEDVLSAAKREVLEETGFSVKSVNLIDTFIPNIGTESEKIHIVYATGALKTKDQSLDTDEYINYYLFSFDEVEYMINNNYIVSGGNKLAFFHLKELINEE